MSTSPRPAPKSRAATFAIILAATLALAPATAQSAQANTGVVNTTFSQAGFTGDPMEWGTAITELHDAKTLVSLLSYNDSVGPGGKSSVARLNIDGTLDTTFGTAGIVTVVNMQGQSTPNATMITGMIELLPSEKILLAVQRPIAGGLGMTLVRLNADGSIDTTFAVAGYADVPARAGADEFLAREMTLQQTSPGQSRLLLAGQEEVGGIPESVVVAVNLDGAVDVTWASGGYLLPITGDFSRADGITTDAHGAVFVMTFSAQGLAREAALSKFDVDGTPVTSFGVSGVVIIQNEPDATEPVDAESVLYPSAVALDAAGNVVVFLEDQWFSTGDHTEGRRMVLLRLLADGSADTSFATNGRFSSSFLPGALTNASALLIRGDGTIFTLGAIMPADQPQFFYVAAFTPTGAPDPTFGTAGLVTFSTGSPDGFVAGLVLTPSGNLLTLASVGDNPSCFAQVVAIDTNAAPTPVQPELAATGFASEPLALAALLLLTAGLVLAARRSSVTSGG